jgi:hypothetical protein
MSSFYADTDYGGDGLISQEQAGVVLKDAAQELMEMSYDELCQLDKRLPPWPDEMWRELTTVTVDNEEYHVIVLMSDIGVIRRRMCVELILQHTAGFQWRRVPCVYFERYKSGRLRIV